MKRTIVLGKFSPLHIGHISLIQFAERSYTGLTILVDNNDCFDIPISDRVSILKRTFPHLDIRGIKESTFQNPEESDMFWEYWEKIINKYIPEGISCIVGSMDYVKELALKMGCSYTIIDRERLAINISATEIKKDLNKNWHYLAPESKAYLTKSIAIVGAESCGKSTLTKKLAEKFNTVFVPEYARSFIESHGQKFDSNDLIHIAQAHYNHAEVLKTQASNLFFYDTEAITTNCWNDFFFNIHKKEIQQIINKQKINLYLLVPVQDTWVKDDVRYQEQKEERIKFYNNLKELLVNNNQKFIELTKTNWDDLLEESSKIIKEIYE